MSTTIKTGWLNDQNGDKFAPKTLTSQVQTNDGILLEDKIQADLDAAKEDILSNVAIDVDSELSSTSTNPVQNKVVYGMIDQMVTEFGEALENKADASHTHAIADVSGLQSALDGKAASSHGTHVTYSTTTPVMDGTASTGSASTVARSDHKHPTDTSRASQTDFDTHVADATKHITSTERTSWNTAKTHADSAHAPSNAEKNQNAFSNITVGSTTVAANTATDTVTFVGSNVTITPDITNDKITFAVADGSTSGKGVVQLINSTSSTSTTTAATPNSVKTAYDLANTAKTNAATAQTRADNAYALAESKVDSLSDLGVTATATELNYMDGVTSNVQTQLDGKASSSHALSKGTDATATKTLAFGETFTAVTDTAVSGHQITDTTTTYTMPSDRLFTTLVPTGTSIPANADLNTATYLKVGRYFCSKTADAATLTNCPLSVAFMMEVSSPLSTTIDNETNKTWVYRLRKITAYNTGVQYVQYCNVGATAGSWVYDDWYVVPRSTFTLDSSDENGGSATLGSSTKPVYVASDGTLTACKGSLESNYGITTAGTGDAYTATVDGITSLTAGVSFIMIPNVVSTSTAPTLNVNSLGAKTIRRRVSNSVGSTTTGYNASWLTASKPIRVEYDGTYWIADLPKPAAADISGTLSVSKGGTGKTSITAGNYIVGNGTSAVTSKTPAEVLEDIGAVNTETVNTLIDARTSKVSVKAYGAKGDGSTDDTTAFQSALANNRIVFVPEGTYKLSGTIVIRSNCQLELSQATILQFTQTSGNCIEMGCSATLNGNHANISVPYSFSGHMIDVDTTDETERDTPPYTHWTPMWKSGRYIYDVCLVKSNSSGLHYSTNGTCSGTAIYMSANGVAALGYIWGAMLQGIRIAGAFTYGIQIINYDDPNDSSEDDAWNHDMRIEAVIQGCETGVHMTNCNTSHLAVTIQPNTAENGTKYAKWGVYLNDCKYIDMTSSLIWDWSETNTKWSADNEYQHIAMYGNCKGLVLSDFTYYANSADIRSLIYTDTPSNLEKMTILQEPITRWFKQKDGVPYFNDGFIDKQLATKEDFDAHFDADIVKGFTDVLAAATDASGNVYNGVGYVDNTGYYNSAWGGYVEGTYYFHTGFIPVKAGDVIYGKGLSFNRGYDGNCRVVFFTSSFSNSTNSVSCKFLSAETLVKNGGDYYLAYEGNDDSFKLTVKAKDGSGYNINTNIAYIRFQMSAQSVGENPMISVNEEIKYAAEGFLAESVKVNGKNIIMTSPSGKSFKLIVSDSGALSTAALA